MKVLFITNGDASDPSSRVRVHQYVPFLRSSAITVSVVPLASRSQLLSWIKRLWIVLRALSCDVVVIQKAVVPGLTQLLAGVLRRPMILDLDDAPFLYYPGQDRLFPFYRAVVVGNEEIATHVRGFNPRVVVIPSVVDETRFDGVRCQPVTSSETLVIGWIGHGSNLRYLEPLRPVFRELARRFPGKMTLKVVSGEPLAWDDVPLENKPWRLEEEARDVASFDIGVMPLTDDAWSRMKCGYKALLYMFMGIPTVVSPVGVNKTIVKDCDTGFHAVTPSEWSLILGQLLEDGALRQRIGRAGQGVVEKQYTIRAVLPLWIATLNTARGGSRTSGS